ncbi:MAG: hypothetical protein U1E45_01155 [Geminicoccaceae bacterium]
MLTPAVLDDLRVPIVYWNHPEISVGRTALIPLIELGPQEDADCAAFE